MKDARRVAKASLTVAMVAVYPTPSAAMVKASTAGETRMRKIAVSWYTALMLGNSCISQHTFNAAAFYCSVHEFLVSVVAAFPRSKGHDTHDKSSFTRKLY
jgi:hypothetical protein